MTVIEKQYMESVININRMMRKAQEAAPDWEQRRYEIAKDLYPKMLLESAKLPCGDDEKLVVVTVATVKAAELLVEALKANPLKETE